MNAIKLSQWARENGLTYRGALNHYNKFGITGAYVLPSGSIMIRPEEKIIQKQEKVVIYARVSTAKQKKDLDTQAQRISEYCIANGWKISSIKKEIASGLNDKRKKLLEIFKDKEITKVVVEHKDRLTRFGFNYIEEYLKSFGCEIVIINKVETDKDDLVQDFVSIITSMVARLYSKRKSKRKTEQLIKELKSENE